MMKSVLTFRNLVLFLSLVSIASCKKNDSTPAHREISKIDYILQQPGKSPRFNTYVLNYNSKGWVTSIAQTNPDSNTQATQAYTASFAYHNGSIVINTQSGSDYAITMNRDGRIFSQYDSLTLNGKNQVIGIYDARMFPDSANRPTQYSSLNFQYLNYEMQTSSSSGPYSILDNTQGSTTYTWENGDLISTSSSVSSLPSVGNGTTYYQYDHAHKFQVGDYNQLRVFMQTGNNLYPTSHLVTGITDYLGNNTVVTYEFDADGNIIQVVATGNQNTETFTLHYSYF